MTRAPLKAVAPDAPVSSARQLLVDGLLHQVPVVEDGRIVGPLGRAELLRLFEPRDELDLTLGRRPGPELWARPRAESAHRAA